MENPVENSKICDLLQEQNTLLREVLAILKRKERFETAGFAWHLLLNLLPFIIIMIVGYYLYTTLTAYLEVLNNNINTLKEGYLSMQGFIAKLIPDFSGIGEKIMQSWQETTNLFQSK